jgi:multiple sugar transport system ATP-binding protein
MADLSLENIGKRYNQFEVVKDVSLSIRSGEFIVLVGPSGCGKSTTLRMIAGLEDISSGDLLIDGKRVNDVPPRDRDIAMVFQSYALYPHMNLYDNMAFGLRVRGFSEVEIAPRVEEAAQMLGLSELLKRFPKELSGGQRQRVAMGRAIVRRAQIFLFDEPLSNLDAALRVRMRAEIAQLHKRMKATTIYVTHDQVEAMTLADRIVVMRGGVVQQIGSPMEVFHRPQNKFVAAFLGSPPMNFLPATVSDDGESLAVHGVSVPLRAPALRGRSVLLGVRPQQLVRSTTGIPAQVEVVERTGAEAYLHARAQDQTVIAKVSPQEHLENTVYLQPDPNAIYLFDKDTEALLQEATQAHAETNHA